MELNINIEENFWKINPQFKLVPEFKVLFDGDKGKDSSSRLMWAIVLLLDTSSVYSNIPETDRRGLIAKDFLKEPKFPWSKIEPQIAVFEEHMLSQAKRVLRIWNTKMEERATFIMGTKYNLDTIDILDKAMGNTKKLYEEYNRIQDMLKDDGMKERSKGGKELSATDKGDI